MAARYRPLVRSADLGFRHVPNCAQILHEFRWFWRESFENIGNAPKVVLDEPEDPQISVTVGLFGGCLGRYLMLNGHGRHEVRPFHNDTVSFCL
jgi:hypothetical protein